MDKSAYDFAADFKYKPNRQLKDMDKYKYWMIKGGEGIGMWVGGRFGIVCLRH